MKILVLSHISDLLGGAERSMLDTFDYWAKHYDIEPEFIMRLPVKSLGAELKKRGWKYYAIDYTFWSEAVPPSTPEAVFEKAVRNNKAIAEIEKIIQKSKPDVVMTNTIVAPWAALAAHFQKKPHVWFVREYGDLDHGRIFDMDQAKTLTDIGNLSDLVVTVSRTLGKHVEQYVPEEKVTALYTPFKIDEIKAQAKEAIQTPFKRAGSLKLVITGNLAASKGQLELVKAVGELTREGHDIEVCMVGSAEGQKGYVADIHETIEKHGLQDSVHFAGYQKNPLPFIVASDVGVMASRKEAFGRVTFEYLLLGKPVVGANGGATPEMVLNGKNGYLYEPNDVQSLKSALAHYAKNKQLAAKHGEASCEVAETMLQGQYNADALFKRVEAVVKQAGKAERHPINYLRQEMDYVLLAKQIVERSGALSIRHVVRSRLRQKAKGVYYRARTLKAKITGK